MHVGQRLRMTKPIWDDGCENHHPSGYIAFVGDVVIVRRLKGERIYVSHPDVTDNSFWVTEDEVVDVRPEANT